MNSTSTLDLVTGRVIFGANHKRVQGPYHVVHSENWAVYTYYNEKSRRAELGSLELFEGKTQSNATVFSSLHNNLSPLVERQAYILAPSYVTALKDTVTEKGITTKNLLMVTATGSMYNIPRGFLDPRRPNMNTPLGMFLPLKFWSQAFYFSRKKTIKCPSMLVHIRNQIANFETKLHHK